MKPCKSCAWAAMAALIGAGAIFMAPDTEARPAATAAAATAFEVDAVHSMIVFRIKHMGVSYTYGTIHQPDGSYTLDFDNPSNSTLQVAAKIENIDTGNDGRDKHLKSPDFFSSKQFPDISFVGKTFEKIEDGKMLVTGGLTMLGKTNEVQAHIEWVGQADTGRGIKSGFEAEFKINRSEWGMTKYIDEGALGDEVTLYVTIEGNAV